MSLCLTAWWPRRKQALDEGLLRVLAGLRIAFALLFLYGVVAFGSRIWLLSTMPETLWAPVGVANFIAVPVQPAYAHALFVLALASCLFVLTGAFTTFASGTLFVTLVFLGSTGYSFGKIDHGYHLLILMCFILGSSPWGARVSIDSLLRRRRGQPPVRPVSLWPDWPLRGAVFLIGLLYFASGALKVAYGSFLQPGTMSMFLARRSARMEEVGPPLVEPWASISEFVITHPFVGDVLSYLTVALELGVILAVLNRRLAVFAMGSIVVFHASIRMLSGIGFTFNLLTALLLGLAFAIIILRDDHPRLSRILPRAPETRSDIEPSGAPAEKPFLFSILAAVVTLLLLSWVPIWGFEVPLDPVGLARLQAILPSLGHVGLITAYLMIGLGMLAWAATSIAGRLTMALRTSSHDIPHGVLLYDGDCGFCQQWVDWARKKGPMNVEFAPFQSQSRFYERHGLQASDFLDRAYFIIQGTEDRDLLRVGRQESGAAAILAVHERFPRRRDLLWRITGTARRLMGVHAVLQTAYCIIARNRHRLGRRSIACHSGGQTD